MNNKQRVTSQIKHQETDFIPYTLLFDSNGDIEDRLDEKYGSRGWRRLLDNAIEYLPLPTAGLAVDEKAELYSKDLYGTTWQVNLRPHHIVEPALKEPTLVGYQFPTIAECIDPGWEASTLSLMAAKPGYFWVAQIGFGLFERTWTLRGFDNALMDVSLNPEFYEELAERLAENQMEMVERMLRLPFDGFLFSDDWGYQDGILIGAKRWRKVIKPHMARLYERVHRAGKYTLTHICGSVAEILPDLIEIGLDVYESVQPEAKNNNPYELKRKYGTDITFWGGLGSQSLLPFGTPSGIKSEVAHLCQEMGKGGGYILSPAKAIQPETPVENAAAAVEAFLAQSGNLNP
jgi:uroporphyrinogen decarboxylase